MIDSIKIALLGFLNKVVRRNKSITRLLFGLQVNSDQRIHWDFTTLLLRNCLLQKVKEGNDVLEIGTGPDAILSTFLKRHVLCNCVACDIDENYVISARKTAELNGVKIRIVRSDLFENITDKFDIVFFNSVYIPASVGKRLGIDRLHRRETDWCGGVQGTDTIQRFLRDAPAFLQDSGQILLGFNSKYLNENLVIEISTKYGYSIASVYKKVLNPSRVFIIQKVHRC